MSVKTKMMTQWWQSPLGQYVLTQEQGLLQTLSRHFHGYFHVQVDGGKNILPQVSHANKQAMMAALADLHGQAEYLPFKCHSVDNLLLPHVLEFSADPHQVLREVERVLVADGTIILCCFNPISLWGIRRLFSWQAQAPWRGHFFSLARIKDWLGLLNFEVVATEKYLFCPPINNNTWLTRLVVMDKWGKHWWSLFGGATIVVATKRTIPLTPINSRWRYKQLFPSGRFVKKPVTRWSSKPE
ncbi:methylase [Methylophaga sp. 42_25_T18]|nr:methylase [Methylophaga sp. 42_25_T18]OUR85882.1 methylase [Methylophaga sp. 42_8_T64]